MKYIFTLLLCFGFISISSSFGQEETKKEETKKVVIIKKTIDDNGKATTERQEASGKEADALIKKLKDDGSLEGMDIDIEIEKAKKAPGTKTKKSKEVTVEKTMENGKEMTTYKIVTEENGEKKVTVWKGDGEMPAEIEALLKDDEVTTKSDGDKKEMRITIELDDEDEDYDYDFDEGEDEDEDDSDIQEKYKIEERIVKRNYNNKVTLGIMIEDDRQGVVVSEVVEGSAADKSGLKSGDTVIKINDTYVFNTDMLLKALSAFDKGDKIKITYLRGGKEKKTNAKF